MDTGELADIWKKNDRTAWSDDAFHVIEKILKDRGEVLEGQASPMSLADPFQQTHAAKGFPFKKLWRGEEPLVVAFWLYGFLPTAALKLFILAGKLPASMQIVMIFALVTYCPIPLVGNLAKRGLVYRFLAMVRLGAFLGGPRMVIFAADYSQSAGSW